MQVKYWQFVFLVAKPLQIFIYYSMQAVLIGKVVINCKNR